MSESVSRGLTTWTPAGGGDPDGAVARFAGRGVGAGRNLERIDAAGRGHPATELRVQIADGSGREARQTLQLLELDREGHGHDLVGHRLLRRDLKAIALRL